MSCSTSIPSTHKFSAPVNSEMTSNQKGERESAISGNGMYFEFSSSLLLQSFSLCLCQHNQKAFRLIKPSHRELALKVAETSNSDVRCYCERFSQSNSWRCEKKRVDKRTETATRLCSTLFEARELNSQRNRGEKRVLFSN